jgi:hypothetical protein
MLEAQLKNAVFCREGAFEIDGNSYPYIVLYDDERNVRLSLDKACTPPAGLKFGEKVDVWFQISQDSKSTAGRPVDVMKLRALDVVRAGEKSLKVAA